MMTNRDALRKLSRKYPAPPEVEKILGDLRDNADVSVAVVCVALLDASLERLIASHFVHKKPNLAGQIFRNRGPLSDFQSKILVASAFDIITPRMADEMDTLRVIRNAFAHAKVPVSFEHELVDREIKTLRMLQAFGSGKMPKSIKMDLTNKGWFLLITRLLLIMVEGLLEGSGRAHDLIQEWLDEHDEKTSRDKSRKPRPSRSKNPGHSQKDN